MEEEKKQWCCDCHKDSTEECDKEDHLIIPKVHCFCGAVIGYCSHGEFRNTW